jgi:hypothetical protein
MFSVYEVANGSLRYANAARLPLFKPHLNIAVPHALEINHRRSDIVVSHPLLQSADINAVLQDSAWRRCGGIYGETTACSTDHRRSDWFSRSRPPAFGP